MPDEPNDSAIPEPLRELLQSGPISFRDFVSRALYEPEWGYYTQGPGARARHADYITAPAISPVFAWTLARLAGEFVANTGDIGSTIVDIGCGDGALIAGIAREFVAAAPARFLGIDRSLAFVPDERRNSGLVEFATSFDSIPTRGPVLIMTNELFDAFPFTRLVRRADGLHELGVMLDGDRLDWTEWPADPEWENYFAGHAVTLLEGQFADVTLDWGLAYSDICGRIERGLLVTFDYGFESRKLFDPRIRKYGTAGAYSRHQVHRDLLRNPGRQDLTAHVNFDDLMRAGEAKGFKTLTFTRQARFLLSLGAAEHPLFAPLDESGGFEAAVALQTEREAARRLVVPDGIGDEMRVLVQARGLEQTGWSFLSNMTSVRK